MRTTLAVFALFVPFVLFAAAAEAQPDDRVLIDEILEASAVAETSGAPLAASLGLDRAAAERIGDAIADAARGELVRAFSTAELEQLRDRARGEAWSALTARALHVAPRVWDLAFAAELGRMLATNDDSELADAALTAEYLASRGDDRSDLLVAELAAAINRLNPARAAELKAGGVYNAILDDMDAPDDPLTARIEEVGERYGLFGVPEPHVREMIRFNESALGARFNRAIEHAVYRGFAPTFAVVFLDALDAPPPPPPRVMEIPPSDPLAGPPPPATSGDETYDVAEVQPELIGGLEALQRRVEYPRLAREAGIEGRVFVQFIVDETGAVIDPVVTRSPSELLSDASLAAVRESRFVPGTVDGQRVKVRFLLPINFVLDEGERFVKFPEVPAQVVGGLDEIQSALDYPDAAREAGIGGTVHVQVTVSSDGEVTGVETLRSPDPRLTVAAEAAVRSARYLPATDRGRRVASRISVPVRFVLVPAADG